jgi:hypothetical protein
VVLVAEALPIMPETIVWTRATRPRSADLSEITGQTGPSD